MPSTAVATDRRPDRPDGRIRVGIIGATGYVGSELIRLLTNHPAVEIVGLQGRDRDHEPIGATHAHLSGTGLAVDASLPAVDAVFIAASCKPFEPRRPPSSATRAAIRPRPSWPSPRLRAPD